MPTSSRLREFFEILEEDTDEQMIAVFWMQMAQIAVATLETTRGGSRPGKSRNVERNHAQAHLHYTTKYFWPSDLLRPGTNSFGPEQSESAFERRFRMPRNIFNKVMETCLAHSPYIIQGLKPDCTGKMGISPLMKVICALRTLSYGISADLSEDMFNISETTANKCLEEFSEAVIKGLKSQYLRDPTFEEIIRIEKQFASAGFPGCLGCVDCAGWVWKNCPVALQGIMTGKGGKPESRMEVICDLDLRIWSFQFGLPGAFNDLNILEVSDYFGRVLSGNFPPVSPRYKINGKEFTWYYYLADGIYPKWRIFIQSSPESTDRKGKHFSAAQEAIRKSIERVFGVLYKRFKLLFVACEFWTVAKMKSIATAAVILHNMVVEERKGSYSSDGTAGRSTFYNNDEDSNELMFVHRSPADIVLRQSSAVVSDDIKIKGMHRDLKSALIEHQWEQFGGEE